jgi:hypothetical protein
MLESVKIRFAKAGKLLIVAVATRLGNRKIKECLFMVNQGS